MRTGGRSGLVLPALAVAVVVVHARLDPRARAVLGAHAFAAHRRRQRRPAAGGRQQQQQQERRGGGGRRRRRVHFFWKN
jgi:hypothetical protein